MFDTDFNPYDRIEQLEAYVMTLFGITEELAANNSRNSQNILSLTQHAKTLIERVEEQQRIITMLYNKIKFSEVNHGNE